MNYIYPAIAGIIGTALMTGFLYILANITGKDYKVIRILGNLLVRRSNGKSDLYYNRQALFTGIVAHYAIGVMFAYIYVWLWQHGIGRPDFVNAIIFGALNGLFAITFWYMLLILHRNPPRQPTPDYLLTIAIGHIIFSLGTVLVFKSFPDQMRPAYNCLFCH